MRNLSNELFFEAYRGFPTGKKHFIKKALGMHWSANKEIAHRFSDGSTAWSAGRKHGVIVHANIPVSSVETDPKTLWKQKVSGDLEQEVPVKKGAQILVTGITKRKGEKTRTRKFNPPRNMTA